MTVISLCCIFPSKKKKSVVKGHPCISSPMPLHWLICLHNYLTLYWVHSSSVPNAHLLHFSLYKLVVRLCLLLSLKGFVIFGGPVIIHFKHAVYLLYIYSRKVEESLLKVCFWDNIWTDPVSHQVEASLCFSLTENNENLSLVFGLISLYLLLFHIYCNEANNRHRWYM